MNYDWISHLSPPLPPDTGCELVVLKVVLPAIHFSIAPPQPPPPNLEGIFLVGMKCPMVTQDLNPSPS